MGRAITRHVGDGARRRRWADLRFGGTSGNGRLLVSWIYDIEFVNALDWIITREHIAGAINLAAPGPLPNAAFRLEIGSIILGTETELVRKRRRVVPGRLREDGFPFQFPPRDQAARDLCSRWRHREGAVE